MNTMTVHNYKPLSKAEAKRRIIKAGGVQTMGYATWDNNLRDWVLSRTNNPGWRNLDKVQTKSLNLGGTWLDLDNLTDVYEYDDTTLIVVWRLDDTQLLSRATYSLVPRD